MFDYPKDFSSQEYFSDAFAIWPNGKLHTIKVRIDSIIAPYARERFWHTSQKTAKTRDGGLLVSLKVRGFEEVGEWVLSMGEHAEAVSPKAFRDYIKDRLARSLSKYDS